jgi:Calx-beta domain/Fibronectin type III domain
MAAKQHGSSIYSRYDRRSSNISKKNREIFGDNMKVLKTVGYLALLIAALCFNIAAQESSSNKPQVEPGQPVAIVDGYGPHAVFASTARDGVKGDAPSAVNNYATAITPGITYSSISGTGTNVTAWRNGTSTDDNLSTSQPIGFTFIYNGGAYQNFLVSTNGFVTFNTGTSAIGSLTGAYGYQNTNFSTSGGTVNSLAPFYEDQQTAGNLGTIADLNNSIKYQTTGVAGSRVLTVEWINFQDFSTTSTASFNYQVKLYEADGHIEYVYGTMNQAGTTTVFSYTLGINASTVSATPAASELLTQQTANTNTFSNTPSNALATVPASNSMVSFTPPANVPNAPTNLTFTGTGVSTTTLNWIDNATNEINYNVLISSDGGVTYQTFGAILAPNATSITITGLAANTTYFFKVIATTEGVASAPVINSVTTNPPVSGTKTIGPGGDYTTFAAAISDVNAGPGAGGVTFNVTAGATFPENGTCITGGSSTTPVIFQKFGAGANPVIVPPGSASTADTGICILGGDYITFDGIDIAEAAGNTSVELGVAVQNLTTTNGATNNTIKNMSITLNRAVSPNVTTGIQQFAAVTPTSAAGANSGNKYQNLTIRNVGEGILLQGSTAAGFQDTGNEVSTTSPTAFNSIGSPTTAGDIGSFAGTIYGIQAVAQSGVIIRNNEIQNITDLSVSSSVYGIYMNNTGSNTFSVGTNQISNNKIHDIQLTGASTTGVVYGIREELTNIAASTDNVFNNFVYNLNTTSVTVATRQIIGIASQISGSAAASTHNINNNSVRIAPTSVAASNACLQLGTSTNVNKIQNNIFSNFTGAQTGSAKHYTFVSTSASALGGAGSVSNFNDLYVANTTNGYVGLGNATDYATIANFRTAYSQDANSISADPLFVASNDLHVSGASPVIDAGTTLAGVTNDIDNDTRPQGAAYDIGADEYLAAPGTVQFNPTTYTSNEGTTVNLLITRTNGSSGSITVDVTLNNGSATGGLACGAGIDFVNPGVQTITLGNNVTSANVPVQICSDGVLDPGESFTATLSNTTGGATIGAGSTATVNITDVAPPFNGNYNVGTGNPYTSLTNTGGIFDAINTAGGAGNIVINITSDLTAETGTVALNQITGGYTVTIKPSGAARTISGAATTSLIRLNGADGVTIDGSLTGGSDKSLTISNTSTSGAVVSLLNEATVNVVKNSVLQGVSTSSNGVVFFSTVSSGTVGNSTNTIQNNDIRGGATSTTYGVYNLGTSTAKNAGNVITGNRIFNFATAGIYDGGSSSNATYSRNEIFQQTVQISTTMYAYSPQSTSIDGFTFTQNYIHDLNTSGASAAIYAIYLFDTNSAGPTSVISNNMISLSPVSTTTTLRGIYHNTAASEKYNEYFNSIYLGGTTASGTSEAIFRSVGDTTDLKNNILVNARTTTGTGKQYAIRLGTLTGFTSNYNDIYNTGAGAAGTNVFGNDGTADRASLSAWTAANPTLDVNSLSLDPQFVNAAANNLHITAASPVLGTGTSIAGITTDFDGDPRPVSNPDMGADQIVRSQGGTIAGGTYYNAIAGVGDTFGGNVTVTGAFYLSGLTNTAGNTLTIDCNATVSGANATNFVVGNVKKNFCSTGAFSYPVGDNTGTAEYSPLDVNVTALGTNPSSLTVSVTDDFLPGLLQATAASRYWTLTKTGALTADMTFHYLDSDVNGNESNYKSFKRELGMTAVVPGSTNDPVNNTVSVTGITSFSDWGIGDFAPTAASGSIGGRVTAANGQGIRNAVVVLSGGNLDHAVTARTGSLGYYQFDDLAVGQSYVMTVVSKRFTFSQATQVINFIESRGDVNFTADPIVDMTNQQNGSQDKDGEKP